MASIVHPVPDVMSSRPDDVSQPVHAVQIDRSPHLLDLLTELLVKICTLALNPFTASSILEFLPPPRQIPTVRDKGPNPDIDVVSTYDSRKVSSKVSLLRTCRFIYSLTRTLPLEFYPLRSDCSVLGTHTLDEQIFPRFVQSWQWPSLRRLEIKALYAWNLVSFLQWGQKEVNGPCRNQRSPI